MPSTPQKQYDVAIVGGGVIGLSAARALSEGQPDWRIAVFEAQTGAREASWAAAGMLAPFSEFTQESPLFQLCRESADLYPEFVGALRRESDLPVTLVESGSLLVQASEAKADEVEAARRFAEQVGAEHEYLQGAVLRQREPGLNPNVPRALWMPERVVNNRQLWEALAEACRRRGVALHWSTPVERVDIQQNRVGALHAQGDVVRAETIVIATGAWSQELGRLFGVSIPVVPVKGQMLRFAVPDGTIRHTIHRGSTYVVPRPGFGVIVGTTVEDRGFDHSVEDETVERLAGGAAALVPALAGCVPCETWAGLRPKAPDGLPILGAVPHLENVILATGHFRNGILLTPITGRIVAGLCAGHGDESLAPFDPARFTTTSEA